MSVVTAPLGFAPRDTVVDDDERPGLLRSPTVGRASVYGRASTGENCRIRDIDAAERPPSFGEAGFEAVRLPDRPGLVDLLAELWRATAIADDQADRLRALLTGAVIRLADGSGLRLDHVADEGVILRVAGPNGTDVDGAEHGAAANVHVDQDVGGTPLRQLFDGAATGVFAHDAPDSANHTSTQYLVNLWLPVQQVTRPLTLMDGRTIDRRRHQLRYRLPVESFLDRDEDQSVNDIWQCLHDPAQEWWFRSEMGIGDAFVFDTLSTPHASFVLPGEDIAAERHTRLGAVAGAVRRGDLTQAAGLASSGPTAAGAPATQALRAAVDAIDAVLSALPGGGDVPTRDAWLDQAERAREAVVRRSVELRAVATHTPTGG